MSITFATIAAGKQQYLQPHIRKLVDKNYMNLHDISTIYERDIKSIDEYDPSNCLCVDDDYDKVRGEHDCAYINYIMQHLQSFNNLLWTAMQDLDHFRDIDNKAFKENISKIGALLRENDKMIKQYSGDMPAL